MTKTNYAFSLKESNICKGIAVILMLFHHLFFDPQDYEVFMDSLIFSPFTAERVMFLAKLSKICIVIFVFITGYGITVTYRQKFSAHVPSARELWEFIWKRYWKLMTSYWFVFVLALFFKILSGTFFDTFGNKPKGIFVYLFLDFFGLASFHVTPTLNSTWWYISLAILLIVLVPIMLRIMHNLGTIPVILSSFLLLLFTRIQNEYTFCIWSLLLGIACAQLNLFEKTAPNSKKSWFLTAAIELIILLFLLSLRTNYNYSGIIDGFIALFLALLVHSLLSKIRGLSDLLEYLGRHSGNIFMIHTFLYFYYFKDFFYSLRHWLIILAALLLASTLISIVLEWLKKKTCYLKFMDLLYVRLLNFFSEENIRL